MDERLKPGPVSTPAESAQFLADLGKVHRRFTASAKMGWTFTAIGWMPGLMSYVVFDPSGKEVGMISTMIPERALKGMDGLGIPE